MNFVNDSTCVNEDDESVAAQKFWKKVYKIEEFSLLSDLVERIYVLPHSSATVERIFSAMNLNKTMLRNQLCCRTISGLLHSKELSSYEIPFKDFQGMIKLMNSDMYLYHDSAFSGPASAYGSTA